VQLCCTSCSGNYEAQRSYRANGREVYVCSTHRRKGPSICANGVVIPVEEMDESVRRDLEQKVLASDVARKALEARLDQLDSGLSTTERATLEDWRRILRDPDVRQAQSIIRACMEKRILIWNKKGGGISWAAHCDFSNLLCGVVGVPARYWRPQRVT
jgi:hypothetical protein